MLLSLSTLQYIYKREPTKTFSLELIDFCSLHTQHYYFKMIKSSVRDSEVDETVRSKVSHGGYVASDDEVALPNYLVHLPSQNDVIVYSGVEYERVNGGKLDDDVDDAR